MLRIVVSALSLVACIFAFSANTSFINAGTPPPCQFNCDGSGRCTLFVDGMEVVVAGVNSMEGDPIQNVDAENKKVPVICKDFNFNNQNNTYQGRASNTAGADSRVELHSRQVGGVPFYPADATVYSYVDIELNGQQYTSVEPIVLTSTSGLKAWPSQDFVDYEVTEDVEFIGAVDNLTIKAGSTVTMREAQ